MQNVVCNNTCRQCNDKGPGAYKEKQTYKVGGTDYSLCNLGYDVWHGNYKVTSVSQ